VLAEASAKATCKGLHAAVGRDPRWSILNIPPFQSIPVHLRLRLTAVHNRLRLAGAQLVREAPPEGNAPLQRKVHRLGEVDEVGDLDLENEVADAGSSSCVRGGPEEDAELRRLLVDKVAVYAPRLIDRGVYGGQILRCSGYNNLGSAVQVNQASAIVVDGVLGVGNREAVYMSSIGGACSVSGVTSDDLTYGVRAERVAVSATLGIKNNLMLPSTAILVATNNGTVTNTHNAYTGSLSGVSAGTGDITTDPLLTDTYRPKPGSPLLGAGTHLGYTRDIDKKQRPNPPSIGAYDYATLREA